MSNFSAVLASFCLSALLHFWYLGWIDSLLFFPYFIVPKNFSCPPTLIQCSQPPIGRTFYSELLEPQNDAQPCIASLFYHALPRPNSLPLFGSLHGMLKRLIINQSTAFANLRSRTITPFHIPLTTHCTPTELYASLVLPVSLFRRLRGYRDDRDPTAPPPAEAHPT